VVIARGYEAENQGNRGHHHRAEALLGARARRLGDGLPVFAQLACEPDDQDRVLRGNPDQEHHGDLRVDAVLEAGQPERAHGPECRHSERADDRERQHPAFVLGDEEQVREQERVGAAGFLAFYNPALAVAALTLLLGAALIASGTLRLVSSFRFRPESGRGWLLASA
jgi:hypothetical protein